MILLYFSHEDGCNGYCKIKIISYVVLSNNNYDF